MTVTLFHGTAGWAAALLAAVAIVRAASLAEGWLGDRFEMTGLSLPRLRWDRKGTRVRTPFGDDGRITYVIDDDEAGSVAIVCVLGEDGERHLNWFAVSSLTPVGRLESEAAKP